MQIRFAAHTGGNELLKFKFKKRLHYFNYSCILAEDALDTGIYTSGLSKLFLKPDITKNKINKHECISHHSLSTSVLNERRLSKSWNVSLMSIFFLSLSSVTYFRSQCIYNRFRSMFKKSKAWLLQLIRVQWEGGKMACTQVAEVLCGNVYPTSGRDGNFKAKAGPVNESQTRDE